MKTNKKNNKVVEKKDFDFAVHQHEQVPANWYEESLKVDPFQRYWHHSRFREAKKLIDPVDGYILDVGSADGVFSHEIMKKAKAKGLIGIDVLKKSVDWANKHWGKKSKMVFKVGDAHNLGFPDEKFDAIFCNEVLEHVVNPKKVLVDMKRVLKKGGYGVFLVPSDNNLFKVVWWFWLHFYPRGWVWKDTHIQTYRGGSLAKICRQAGFLVEVDRFFNLGMLNIVKVRKV